MQPTEKPLFHIDYDGQWFHDGQPIRRPELVRLFATKGLRRAEDGTYWLQSPESRYAVDVADVPFIVVDYDIQGTGAGQSIILVTNMGDGVALGPEAGLCLRTTPRGDQDIPYITVRPGLEARMGRAVYYKLVALATEEDGTLVLRSGGMNHIIGRIA